MLRVITQSLHSEFLTMVLSPSPQGCSPVQGILAEGHVHSLAGVSDERVRILGETLLSHRTDQGDVCPDVQSRTLFLVSAYILLIGHSGV